MDRKFIHNMVESFYNDRQLYQKDFWNSKNDAINELNNEICTEMDNLYLDDVELFNEVYEMGKSNQQKTIYSLLDQFLNEKYDVEYCEEDLASLGGAVGGAVGSFLQNMISASVFLLGSIVAHPFAALLIACASIMLIIFGWRKISRTGWDLVVKLNNATGAVADFVDKKSQNSRVKREVFNRHLEKCAKKCGIMSKKEITRLLGFTLKGNITTREAEEQSSCLIGCYLNWLIQNIEMLTYNYLQCLKNTSDPIINSQLDAKILLVTEPASDMCQQYYDLLSDHYKSYKDVIDVAFKNMSQERNKYMKMYFDALEKATKKVQ